MEKKIIFVRHAKSDWSTEGLYDIDRPLNHRGYADARRMGKHLNAFFKGATLFISSPAIRAISTAVIIAREIKFPEDKIVMHRNLYEAKISGYEKLIHSCDDQSDTLILVGHNPTISEVVEWFSGTETGELSTCSVVVMKFETVRWIDVNQSFGVIETILSPKLLMDQH